MSGSLRAYLFVTFWLTLTLGAWVWVTYLSH
jgi:hypothetical protein